MKFYKEKKIVIIGLGLTGLSCIDYFLIRGITPKVIDTRLKPPGLKHIISKKIKYHLGSMHETWIQNADLIISSPGFDLSPYAIRKKTKIISDIELFCKEAKKPIIAITGSNGKSTVVSLIAKMAKTAGWNIGVGGNIGTPALYLLKNKKFKLYILEISSFQLEHTYNLKTYVSTMLNITENHMDRYPLGFQSYLSTKLKIYKKAKICLINKNNIQYIPSNILNKHCITFGKSKSDYSLLKQKKCYWLMVNNKKIFNCSKMNLVGKHNYMNALSALALADIMKIPRICILKTLICFSGLSHRFQLIYKNKGVCWINDSKSTNIYSTKAALKSVKFYGTLWLLLGGRSKNTNFNLLKPYLKIDNIKIYCFGEAAYELYKLRPNVSIIMKNIYESVIDISKQVQYGDVVLLSPACASYDQFKNFEARGHFFVKLARKFG